MARSRPKAKAKTPATATPTSTSGDGWTASQWGQTRASLGIGSRQSTQWTRSLDTTVGSVGGHLYISVRRGRLGVVARAERLLDLRHDGRERDDREPRADGEGNDEAEPDEPAGRQRAERDAEAEPHREDGEGRPRLALPREVAGERERRREDERDRDALRQPDERHQDRIGHDPLQQRRRHEEDEAGEQERPAPDPVAGLPDGDLQEHVRDRDRGELEAEPHGRLV